jgi:exodeoxyribonuclease-1
LNNRFRQQSLDHLTTFQPMEMIVRYGGQAPQSITGCYCGQVQGSNSMVGFFDLDAANPEEIDQDNDALLRAISDSPKIIRSVNLNAIPNLLTMETPSDQHHKRAQFIADHPNLQTRIGTLLGERLKSMGEQDRVNVEDKIYQGFYTATDKRLLAQFQNATWSERHQMLSQFQDQRLQDLGLRLIATNAPELLSDEQRRAFTNAWAEKWAIEDDAPWMTIARFRRELAEIEKEGLHDEKRIHDLKSFLKQWAEAPF